MIPPSVLCELVQRWIEVSVDSCDTRHFQESLLSAATAYSDTHDDDLFACGIQVRVWDLG